MNSPGRRGTSIWSGLNAPLWAAALATLLSAGLYVGDQQALWSIPGLDDVERNSVDARFRLRGPLAPQSQDIVIVGIDDQTRQHAPQVFQSRRAMAALLDALSGYEPRAVGLDMLFGSPEIAIDPDVIDQVRDAHRELKSVEDRAPAADRAVAALAAVLEETRGDTELAEAVARSGRVLLGLVFHLAGDEQAARAAEPPGLEAARFGEWVAVPGPSSHRPPAAYAVSRSLPEIARGQRGAGALNVVLDEDGSVRQVYGVIDHGGRFYMPLGLAMALEYLGMDGSYVAGSRAIELTSPGRTWSLPVSRRGALMLWYLGPGRSFPHVSAADVLSGAAPRDALAGKLVLVGYTDATRDKVPTPFDPRLDGVEIHATLAHNILHGELLRRTGPLATLLTILLLGTALTLLQLRRIRKRRAWVAGATALVIIAGYLIVAHVLFSDQALVVEVAAPVLACVAITVTSLIAALATEGREKAQLRAAFSQYVSDVVVEQIVADPSRASLGGERRDLTVLFSDIRGFSSFSENLEPEALSAYLNEYLTPMTRLVLDEGGMLDKYIGDAVMAVYGAPIDMEDHANRACRTALAMLAALAPLNQRWRQQGLPDIAIGIGVNSGPMAVGNMGSAERFSYTVLGDTVNLGARLEGLTKEYRVHVLVGEDTATQARDQYVFRELDWVRVKGRSGTTPIYELVGPREEVTLSNDDLELFAAGLDAYRDRDWDAAHDCFTRFADRHPKDGPAQVMLARVQALRAHPPGADWDGVFHQLSK